MNTNRIVTIRRNALYINIKIIVCCSLTVVLYIILVYLKMIPTEDVAVL